jgi:hypothetical protein
MKNKIVKNIKLIFGGIITTIILFGIITIIQFVVNAICNIIIK